MFSTINKVTHVTVCYSKTPLQNKKKQLITASKEDLTSQLHLTTSADVIRIITLRSLGQRTQFLWFKKLYVNVKETKLILT